MDNSERDTHFQGFAKLEWDKIEAYIRDYGFIPEGETRRAEFLPPLYTLLAQCAYDLGEHVFNHTTEAMTLFDSFKVLTELNEIPDLTEWPTIELTPDLPPELAE